MKNPGTSEELFTKSQFHKSLYTSILSHVPSSYRKSVCKPKKLFKTTAVTQI